MPPRPMMERPKVAVATNAFKSPEEEIAYLSERVAEKQREIAAKGGRASGGNFANDPERAAEAGRKGGRARRRS